MIVIPPQPLGHEIHVSRCIVVDMVCKNNLSLEFGDSIVTSTKDRKFLYEDIFGTKNVFTQGEVTEQIAGEYFILDLRLFAMPPTHCNFASTGQMLEIGYEIPKQYSTENFKKICGQIKYLDRNTLHQMLPQNLGEFCIIHHRGGSSGKTLSAIVDSLPRNFIKIIFTASIEKIKNELQGTQNVFCVENLQIYASLLNDNRCKLLISEWSGGGQLAQYVMNQTGQIWYYFDSYPDVYNYTENHMIWHENSMTGSYLSCWDFKQINNCSRRYFKNVNNLLEAMSFVQ